MLRYSHPRDSGVSKVICTFARWISRHTDQDSPARSYFGPRIGEERFEFDMDPSTTDTLHASGNIYLTEVEAWALLESLSTALSAAGFSHKIGMDDARGELFKRVDTNVRATNHET
jgi:hypothetical protein